jgi:hypothetical protein
MEPDNLTLSEDEFNAHMLGGVMLTTRVPNETAAEARLRRAAIVAMFRAFDPANAMESMTACHCVSMHFVLDAAMRDAGDTTLDHVLLTRARGSAMALSKTLHKWVSTFQAMHKRNEARARDAATPTASAAAIKPTPAPALAKAPPEPRPPAGRPATAIAPAVGWPGTEAPVRPSPGIKETLLASTAILPGARPNGRLSVPPAG